MPPLVSVIIPVYNVKPYLCESINSVINQTYKNLEIIIVDDGSTDGSGEICEKYQGKDSRIHVIHQTNQGLSAARNTGLQAMHGEIVAFLDSDDSMMPNMIETMLNVMEQTNVDIVACSFYICHTAKQLKYSTITRLCKIEDVNLSSQKALSYLIDGKLTPSVWNKLYKSYLFDNLRFPDGRMFEDQIITPFILDIANSIRLIEQPLLYYRIRPHSITTTFTEKNALDWLYAIKTKERFVTKRTPELFTERQRTVLLETDFRGLMMYFSTLLLKSRANMFSKRSRIILEKEIQIRAKRISLFSIKTRIAYKLYCINPFMCSVLLNAYYHSVSVSEKLISIFKRHYYE